MADDIFHPDFKAEPYWWEFAAPDPRNTEGPPARCDAVIVGGGFAGLNAALELARRGTAVTVLEMGPFGQGASTRNAGHVSSGFNLGKAPSSSERSPALRHLGEAGYGALLDEAASSFDHLETLIAREAISCDWRIRGRFVGALTPRHFRALARKSADAPGVNIVERADQYSEIASDFYHGGIAIERSGQLNPALYHRGLMEACRRQGVTLVAECPATAVHRSDGGFRVDTPRGEIRTDGVFVATNGYTGRLVPWLRRRIIPLGSYIIATEPLGAERANALIPTGRTINDTKRVLSYFRLSPDGTRLLFGGRESFRPIDERGSARLLYRTMLRVFPQLQGVRITHSWTGNVAFTFDFLPHLGAVDGVHYAAGCNGSGVAMMSYLGYRAALTMAGGNETSAFERLAHPARWFYRETPWFMPLVGRYYQFRDARDRRRAATGDPT
ncbi:FAD-binding oxidoreductase [Kaustia mangrovi]|uniref:FAD-binding oxidoreductase n=1 Tax=Kaustia mangrovi TaxID=2593653 RepID=A0A7S8C359_9HYPH|nr:FAD-binding oxidoreductase [Kaustia mangrovi]QPC42533.1 FAD-binding oxidoreductase [Kaustia mangrovi]